MKFLKRYSYTIADQIGPYDFEQIARKWNGSGQLTINYWNRIKEYL